MCGGGDGERGVLGAGGVDKLRTEGKLERKCGENVRKAVGLQRIRGTCEGESSLVDVTLHKSINTE